MSEKEFLQKVGFEIRIARMRSCLSGQEVAELSGLTMGALYQIEKGQRNGHILNYKRICDTLGIELNSILPL